MLLRMVTWPMTSGFRMTSYWGRHEIMTFKMCVSSNASSPRVLTELDNLPCEQKPVKNLGEKGAWAYPGTTQIFPGSPIISGTCKATNFKFGIFIGFNSRIVRLRLFDRCLLASTARTCRSYKLDSHCAVKTTTFLFIDVSHVHCENKVR